MRNVLQVLVRDIRRIGNAPKVWAILIGLIVMPSLYAWVNIVAFWDPYTNTEAVKVAVVNLDRGATSEETGQLNVGDQIVAQLKQNHQLGWQFLDKDEAMTAVESGDSYAAIVIPAEFSSDLLSIAKGHFIRPELDYYVNEKVNAISPKITDVGASTLDTQVNSSFVSAVSKSLTEAVRKAGLQTESHLQDAQDNTLTSLIEASTTIETARTGLVDVEASLSGAQTAIGDAEGALRSADDALGQVRSAISEANSLASEVQARLADFTDSVTSAYVSGAAQLSEASAKLNAMVTTLSAGAQRANAAVGSAVDDVSAVVAANAEVIQKLQDLHAQADPSDPGYAQLGTAIEQLQAQAASDQKLMDDLKGLNSDVTRVISAMQSSADAFNNALGDAAASASSIRKVLTGTVPDINRAVSAISASAGAFSSALGAQQVLIGQSTDLLASLRDQLGGTNAALASLDENLADAQNSLENLRTDVSALGTAEIWKQVGAMTGLAPDKIAEFMASPVQVKEHAVFPVKTYGSAMAPLFTNLSLWIGTFMLVVLLKQEVDAEGIDGLTVRQAYLGRFSLLAAFAVVQALLVSIGDLVIGVQMASAPAFVATSVFVGLVYLSIIYALAASFGYIGKGLVILLVVMQIPGASGIYPIEMMPGFFRALYPVFPFTYSIDAMRETIGGFYDGYYWRALGVLLLFAAFAFILGIFFRQRLGNYARLFNRNLASTQLFASEDVQVLGSHRRLTQIVEALGDQSAFRKNTARRAAWFNAHHLTMLRLIVLLALAATAVLVGFGWFFPEAKATMLGLWGVVCLLAIGCVVTVEYIKQNIVFAGRVGEMSEPELQQALLREETATHSNAALDDLHEQAEEPDLDDTLAQETTR